MYICISKAVLFRSLEFWSFDNLKARDPGLFHCEYTFSCQFRFILLSPIQDMKDGISANYSEHREPARKALDTMWPQEIKALLLYFTGI